MSNSTNPDVRLNNVIDKKQGNALKERGPSGYYFSVDRHISSPISHLYHFAESGRPNVNALHSCMCAHMPHRQLPWKLVQGDFAEGRHGMVGMPLRVEMKRL